MTGRTRKRIRLTAREIETVLAVAGDALAEETLSCGGHADGAEAARDLAAFERGMDKLRSMLARIEDRT